MERTFKLIVQKIRLYQELSKSGIVALVLISVLSGYLAGHPFERTFSILKLLLTLSGIFFLASGSSALNQLQEHSIDAKMARTAHRPLPSGRLTSKHVFFFVLTTLSLGGLLLFQVSSTLLILGTIAIISYNGLYTLWWKKHWAFAAIPGAIPGALPILMGYSAASHSILSPGGIYLFFILFFWQMPHFWVLALRYRADYQKGNIPTLPVALGEGITVHQIILWCLAYVGLALIASLFIPVGIVYFIPTLIMSAKLLWELVQFARQPNSKHWLHFFLWVNLSLIVFMSAIVVDLWSVYLIPH